MQLPALGPSTGSSVAALPGSVKQRPARTDRRRSHQAARHEADARFARGRIGKLFTGRDNPGRATGS